VARESWLWKTAQRERVYRYPDSKTPLSVEVKIGEIMQWAAGDDGLVFYEICDPPYIDGRYENL
jgi:hypothetical protein